MAAALPPRRSPAPPSPPPPPPSSSSSSLAAAAQQQRDPLDLAAKVQQYEAFANDVLKKELAAVNVTRARLAAEVQELDELALAVQELAQTQQQQQQQQQQEQQHTPPLQQQQQHPKQPPPPPFKSRVDLGCGVLCRAVVHDTSRLFVAVGMGFHLEVTLAEAPAVIARRQAALRGQMERCLDKAARLRAHLKFVAEAIRELSAL